MKDIKITSDNRIEIKNGDFVLIDGVDRVKQHLTVALKGILPGTWLLDPTVGIDYFSGLAVYTSILKAQIKNAIRNVFGVSILRQFNFEEVNQTYNVTGSVLYDNENLNFNEDISWK